MKKCLCFFILIFIISPFNLNVTLAEKTRGFYAKIQSEAYFYSSPEDDATLFQIPPSYFVLLTADEDSIFYKATYKDISGYVKKEEVTPMSGEPSSPYPNAKFRTFAKEGLGLYSKPSASSSLISTIPYLYKELDFYGYMTGDIDIPEKSNQWYYCSYMGEQGYLYSVFCDKLPVIEENTQIFDIITPDFSSIDNQSSLSSSSLFWIILGVSFPCLVVFLLLLKPNAIRDKLLSGKTHSKRKKDYFEFDETTLN